MNKLSLAVAAFALSAAVASALEGPEAARFGAEASFRGLSGFKAAIPAKLVLKQVAPEGAAVKTGTRVVRLSGHLSLSGNAHIPQGSSFAHVTMSGWTSLTDQDGRRVDGSIHFSETGMYHASGSHVSGWARPSAYVSLYQNGKFLGSGRVDGSIYVSGWNSNGWVNLSGSGPVSGTIYVQE